MNAKDYLYIINKKIFRNKKNRFMIIQFIIGCLFLISAITFKHNFINLIDNSLSKSISFRSLSVTVKTNVEDYGKSELENIDHVIGVYSSKYDAYSVESSFKNDKYDGGIDLIYGDQVTLPEIKYGRTFNNNEENVAICPMEFLPSKQAYNLFSNKNVVLNGLNILDKDFEIIYYSYRFNYGEYEKDKEFHNTFKVIGLYDSNSNMNSKNACYITPTDMIKITDVNTDVDNQNTYYNFIVIVDDFGNVSQVQKEILSLGFLDASIRGELDTKTIDIILLSSNIIISIIIFVLFIIEVLYIKKKQIYDNKFNGILRSCGYSKKQVFLINMLEQIIINIISFIISVIIFMVIWIIIKAIIIENMINMIFSIRLFLSSFVWTFIIAVLLTTIIDGFYILRNNKDEISSMIRSEI